MGGSQQPSDRQLKGAVSITVQDLQWAMSAVKPSAMREVAVDVPKVINRTPDSDRASSRSSGFRVASAISGSLRWFLPSSLKRGEMG